MLNAAQLARTIEHTLLKPEATPSQIDRLCAEAVRYGFAGVCVNPSYVRHAAQRITEACRGRPEHETPRIVSVAGFPLGASLPAVKAEEALRAIEDGAAEIDMVIALGALITGDRAAVRDDIETVARSVHGAGGDKVLKVILETGVLTAEQIILGCQCALEGEADFVKTSTGFHPSGGATVEHVRLLHRYASGMKVKAAGGIRAAAAALAMIEAGAARLGTSTGPAIIEELSQSDR